MTPSILHNDDSFDQLYKEKYRSLSATFWIPLNIALEASEWLSKNDQVLDIGSGVGKFCTIGALTNKVQFTGVEIRKNLHQEAIMVKGKLQLENLVFINEDIINIDFNQYSSFFYYNPFCEFLSVSEKIDASIQSSEVQFLKHEDIVIQKLSKLPKDTRIATYNSPCLPLPSSFELVELKCNNLLSFWIKK